MLFFSFLIKVNTRQENIELILAWLNVSQSLEFFIVLG